MAARPHAGAVLRRGRQRDGTPVSVCRPVASLCCGMRSLSASLVSLGRSAVDACCRRAGRLAAVFAASGDEPGLIAVLAVLALANVVFWIGGPVLFYFLQGAAS